jgi:hypothetical protein
VHVGGGGFLFFAIDLVTAGAASHGPWITNVDCEPYQPNNLQELLFQSFPS